MERLITRKDIAQRLGISTERVRQLGLRRDFPVPAGRRGTAFVWREDELASWAKAHRRRWPTP